MSLNNTGIAIFLRSGGELQRVTLFIYLKTLFCGKG